MAKKRSHMRNENGFGSVVCLDPTGKRRRKPWAIRMTTGWEDGKQKRKYIGYYRTRKEATMALVEHNKSGIDLELTNLTVNEVFEKWFARAEKRAEAKGLTDTVLTTHKMAQKRFGKLGNAPISLLKTDHWQDWMDGLDLKPSSKGRVKQTIGQMYEYAVINDIVAKNYATGIEVNEKVEKVGAIFTEEEIASLWKNSDDRDVQDVLILIYTGMRIGELVQMERTTIFLESKYMVGGSKTEAGRDRIIPIHDNILPFIEKRLERSRYIMHTKGGDSIKYTTAAKRFDALMKRFGWNHKLHDARKTGISLMHTAGIPMEAIRIIVGHSGKDVTEKVYLYKEPKELVKLINTIRIEH